MIVYAIKEGTVIWSDNDGIHKAGRVPLHEPLSVTSSSNMKWYAINRPANLSLEANRDYPDYWVKRSDVISAIPVVIPEDPSEPVRPFFGPTDEAAAVAIVTILKWLKQF